MASMSEDIAKDTLKFTIKQVNVFMRTPEFEEGIVDAVVRSASKRMFKQKKYAIKDEETGETYRDGKVTGVTALETLNKPSMSLKF